MRWLRSPAICIMVWVMATPLLVAWSRRGVVLTVVLVGCVRGVMVHIRVDWVVIHKGPLPTEVIFHQIRFNRLHNSVTIC